jgi:hypothetical protein
MKTRLFQFGTAIAVLFLFGFSPAWAQDFLEDNESYDESNDVDDVPVEDEPSEDEPSEDEPAEDEPSEDEPAEDEPAEDEPSEDEVSDAEDVLEEYRADGRRVYLICLFGDSDHGIVTTKCAKMERELDRTYGARWVTRLNNPSEAQMQRIHDRVGRDIGAVIVVTHSTPDPDEESGYDVWDCPLGPDEIADIFEDEWVIWNGCFSVGICELADNILPTQCEDGILDSGDDTWRDILRCLSRNPREPRDRDEICEEVFGDGWNPEEE